MCNHGSLVKDIKIDDLILARVGLDKLKLENPIKKKKHAVEVHSTLPLLNLLDLLTVTNIYKLQLLNFTHQWHSKKLPNIFNQHFRYASEVDIYNTRYASKSNFYKPRSRTNIGKQTTVAMATELWQQLPTHIKDLSTYNFPKTLKEYLLAEQLTY